MAENIRTLENNRAKFAFEMVRAVKEKKDEYKSWSKKIPVLIKSNGLGQTLAFMKSRNKPETNLMLEQIKNWLIRKNEIQPNEDVIKKITEIDSSIYRRWSRETIALFNWVRRFADGYL
ncbi:MAG: type III-B CRISPR module-associated protein Cmr5 [Calditrichaeota bacterium]|nr:type III-B CRISPR module-associated protein Cmr5 [Calditrichota bacterium]